MYGSFYTNICKLLSSVHGGIKHQRPTVKLPLSKVGLELSRILANLGIINDFTVGQRLSRVRPHARLWDPSATRISGTADAAGYPYMYLTLLLNYDRHKPLWSRATLAAAPQQPTGSSSSSGTPVAIPDPQVFSPPVGINAPTPESVKLFSKPSVQRWIGVKELLEKRRKTRPGIFLLSTTEGLLTDIDCELRGIGGTLLAHLGLPLGHVIQLRGLLRTKYLQELQAALPPGSSPLSPAAALQTNSSSSDEDVLRAKLRAQHMPLGQWDARAASVQGLVARLDAVRAAAGEYLQLCDDVREGPGSSSRALLAQARRLMVDLEVQQAAWQQMQQGGGGSSSSRGSGLDTEGGSGRDSVSGSSGRGSGSSRAAGGERDSSVEQAQGGDVRGRRRGGRSGLFSSSQQQQQQQRGEQQRQGSRPQDRWKP